jgi:uncharacterized membrane protein YbhN (UPF0104 family)
MEPGVPATVRSSMWTRHPPLASGKPVRHSKGGRVCWSVVGGLTTVGIGFLIISELAGVPARVIAACLGWLVVAGVLELLSMVGFVVVFKLVFGGRMSWRQSLTAGLRGLAASTVLPAGGLIGPAAGARSTPSHRVSFRVTTQSAIAFLILTTAPGVLVLGGLGLLLWAGAAAGPHAPALTLLPGGLAIAAVAGAWLGRDHFNDGDGHSRPIRGGMAEAHRLLASPDWHLLGAVGYYAFDNAVLWATFHAYGRTPPLSVIVMGYLVGSLAGTLPLPAGLGAVEGGMIGALVLYGAPAAPAAGAVLLYRALSLSLPVILGAFAWRRGPDRLPRDVHRGRTAGRAWAWVAGGFLRAARQPTADAGKGR